MTRAELDKRAEEVLGSEVHRLSKLSYAEIAGLAEYPETPNNELSIPAELSEYKFTLMKDAQSDDSIRVAIQLYRHRFLGIGRMSADGFFIYPDGRLRRFTEEDVWDVT